MAIDRCIFCQQIRKMTSEHIWGQWVQDYVPRTANKHDLGNVVVRKPGEPDPPQVRIRAGDPINAQVPVVCGPCNSGWLSGIQTRAKPLLIPLFDGRTCSLDESAQAIVASWIAMSTMTGEYISRDNVKVAVSQPDRTWLMNNRTPPLDWRIWIGRHKKIAPSGQWVHVTLPMTDSDDLPEVLSDDDRLPKLQTIAFTVGQLFAVAMSCHYPGITGIWDWRTARRARTRLEQIWPVKQMTLFWPPPTMTDADAESFGTAFLRYSDKLAKRAGYRV